MKKLGRIFADGFYFKNPGLGLFIGLTLSVLANNTLFNAVGIGIITAIALVISEFFVSIFRKHLDYFVAALIAGLLAAGTSTVASLLLAAYYPTIGLAGYSDFTNTLLINIIPFTSCSFIYLSKAKHALNMNPGEALVDSIASGLGFIFALALIGVIREILSSGELVFTFSNNVQGYVHLWDFCLPIFGQPFGGLLVTALLAGLHQCIDNRLAENRVKVIVKE